MKTKGFTLIELLIVIALIGALALGLLATIDPFEQLKKGRDSSTRNTVTEFYNANLRYYGTKGEFPWGTANGGFTSSLNGFAAPLGALISAGELKTNFERVAGPVRLAKVSVLASGQDVLRVCFRPESKNFRRDSNTIYSDAGVVQAGCVAETAIGGAETCNWCID